MVDPLEPRLTAWDLHDHRYVEVADVRDDETFTATRPYAVKIVPSALVT